MLHSNQVVFTALSVQLDGFCLVWMQIVHNGRKDDIKLHPADTHSWFWVGARKGIRL